MTRDDPSRIPAVLDAPFLGRLVPPGDVAAMAVWLASDEAAFATGQMFTVDGGLGAGSPLRPGLF